VNDSPVAEQDKAQAVEGVIRTWSSAAAAAILTPLSVFDALFITPIQHRMVREIARIHWPRDGERARRRLFRTLRWKLVKWNAAIVGAKTISSLPFIPIVGNLVGMSVAYAFTRAVGELSHLYFAGACTMSPRAMAECFDVIYRQQYERAYKLRRDELKAMWRTPAVRGQLKELRKASREGRLSDDEAQRRTEELLNLPAVPGR
jgi:uncharacterized protein (DUF697 family)